MGVCGCEWGCFVGRLGCWLCVKLYNVLITFWGLGLFGVVFGLWLWDDFSVIIRGHIRNEVMK